MYEKQLPQGLTYQKLYQTNIWFLAWVLKQRRCNPDFNRQILSTPFTVIRKYWSDGQLQFLCSFKNGQWHGVSRGWYRNGQLWWEGHWQNCQQHGLSRQWHPDGQLRLEEEWQNGQLISKNYFQKN